MIEILKKQLSHELRNHNLYQSFSLYFSAEGLMKLSDYYEKRAQEEMNHAHWIKEYLINQRVSCNYPEVTIIDTEYSNRLKPFILTVDKEIETTDMINCIVDLSQSEKDWITFNWLMSKLVPEQLEEEKVSNTILKLADENTDWLTKQDSILEYYINK